MQEQTALKFEQLEQILKGLERVVVAFSGGVDSTALAHAAKRALGAGRVLLATADSEVMSRSDLADAGEIAGLLGLPHEVLQTRELDESSFQRNDGERCYHCKRLRFGEILALARDRGYEQVVHGENYDDREDHRPGSRAACEMGVRAPLRVAGLTKAELREYLRAAGLPVWDKPSNACLATRIAYGFSIDAATLARIEQCEEILHDLGYRVCRVRHHGELARIELDEKGIARAAGEDREEIERSLRSAGYDFVALDLGGYRSGSMNRTLGERAQLGLSGERPEDSRRASPGRGS